jgi:phage/plasmid-like protein (TIGR03299 family)
MSHDLTQRLDGTYEMAFVGETPWHGLGQELQQGASFDEWQKAAGMDWHIQSAPVLYTGNEPLPGVFAGQNVLYRSDNNEPLSIVTNRYKPVQPVEVLHFFKSLVDENGFKLHTAGTLKGGRRMWALAETGNFGEVTADDKVGGYLLLSTSCDRTLATTARFTSIRVVCNNTLTMAVGDNANTVSFSHIQKFDHEKVKAKLGNAVSAFGAFIDMGKYLQKQQMNVHASNQFLLNLLRQENQPNELVLAGRNYNKILSLFETESKGNDLVGHTKWGMLNAVTEYVDHFAGHTQDNRLNNAWFGNGERLKNKAKELLLA